MQHTCPDTEFQCAGKQAQQEKHCGTLGASRNVVHSKEQKNIHSFVPSILKRVIEKNSQSARMYVRA